jgi:YbbR domain-containing protein
MSFHDLIFKNFWLKLFSFILATLIWFTVWSNLENDTRLPWRVVRTAKDREFLNRPVMILARSSETNSYKVQPRAVNVTVRGSQVVLDQLREGDLQVFVRPPGLGEPSGPRPVQVYAARGVSVIHVEPRAVTVEHSDTP